MEKSTSTVKYRNLLMCHFIRQKRYTILSTKSLFEEAVEMLYYLPYKNISSDKMIPSIIVKEGLKYKWD